VNVIEQARQAYAPAQFPLRTARSVEAQLISQITAALKKASDNVKVDYPAFIAAIHNNRRFWTTMAIDVAGDDNGLPNALRAQIFYLAEFTELHSKKVIAGNATTDALIEINTAILRGLNSTGVQ